MTGSYAPRPLNTSLLSLTNQMGLRENLVESSLIPVSNPRQDCLISLLGFPWAPSFPLGNVDNGHLLLGVGHCVEPQVSQRTLEPRRDSGSDDTGTIGGDVDPFATEVLPAMIFTCRGNHPNGSRCPGTSLARHLSLCLPSNSTPQHSTR